MHLLTLITLSLAALTTAIASKAPALACSRRAHGIGYECSRIPPTMAPIPRRNDLYTHSETSPHSPVVTQTAPATKSPAVPPRCPNGEKICRPSHPASTTQVKSKIVRRAPPTITSSPMDNNDSTLTMTTTTRVPPVPKCIHFGWYDGADCSSLVNSISSAHVASTSAFHLPIPPTTTSGHDFGYTSHTSAAEKTKTTSPAATSKTMSTLRLAQASSSSSSSFGSGTEAVTRSSATTTHGGSSTAVGTTAAVTTSFSGSRAGTSTSTVKTTKASTGGSPGVTALANVAVAGMVAALVL